MVNSKHALPWNALASSARAALSSRSYSGVRRSCKSALNHWQFALSLPQVHQAAFAVPVPAQVEACGRQSALPAQATLLVDCSLTWMAPAHVRLELSVGTAEACWQAVCCTANTMAGE